MKVKLLEGNEMYLAKMVQAVAFEWDMDYQKEKEACEAMTEEDLAKFSGPQSMEAPALPSDPFRKIKSWAAFSDDGKQILGDMNVYTYTVNFDGHQTLMGGYGGVSTLPTFRRGGVIRACMTASLEDLYQTGCPFAFLYPFSRAYYRQFGFENGPRACSWVIELDALKPQKIPGTMRQLLPGDDLSPLTKIYNAFYQNYNLAVVRKKYDPELMVEKLIQEHRYLYVWYNESGEPRGFFIAKKTENRRMDCCTTFWLKNAFIALDSQAFHAMLHFIRNTFSADYDSLTLTVPENLHIEPLISEGNKAQCNVQLNGMARIVHVEKALEMCRCKGEGCLYIQVEDPVLSQNSGVWKLSFSTGKPNQVEKCQSQPDITLPIGDLTSLLCGMRDVEDIAFMPQTIVHHLDAPLEQVFYRKPCHVLELF